MSDPEREHARCMAVPPLILRAQARGLPVLIH